MAKKTFGGVAKSVYAEQEQQRQKNAETEASRTEKVKAASADARRRHEKASTDAQKPASRRSKAAGKRKSGSPTPTTPQERTGDSSGPITEVDRLAAKADDLPRCSHGNHLLDHSGEALEPPCGCRWHPVGKVCVGTVKFNDGPDGEKLVPKCEHGNPLEDQHGNLLLPECGCRYVDRPTEADSAVCDVCQQPLQGTSWCRCSKCHETFHTRCTVGHVCKPACVECGAVGFEVSEDGLCNGCAAAASFGGSSETGSQATPHGQPQTETETAPVEIESASRETAPVAKVCWLCNGSGRIKATRRDTHEEKTLMCPECGGKGAETPADDFENAWKQRVFQAESMLTDAEERVSECKFAVEAAKGRLKAAEAKYAECVGIVRDAIRNRGQGLLPFKEGGEGTDTDRRLTEQNPKTSEPAQAPTDVRPPAGEKEGRVDVSRLLPGEVRVLPAEDDQGWGEWPISKLGLPDSTIAALGVAKIGTVGDLAVFTKENQLQDIAGIGEAKQRQIEDACEKFFAEKPWLNREPELAGEGS